MTLALEVILKIKLIVVGTIKDKNLQSLINEYKLRISKYATVEEIIINETLEPKNASENDIKRVIGSEGAKILQKIKDREYVIALDKDGYDLDSIAFSNLIKNGLVNGDGTIDFVIGGSNGLSEDVKKKAHRTVSFSKLTFPHQLFRLILLEQIYRSFKILNNEPYHK